MLSRVAKCIIILVFCFCLKIESTRAEVLTLDPAQQKNILEKSSRDLVLKIAGKEQLLSKSEIVRWIQEKNDLVFSKNYFSEIENRNFCGYKKSLACRLSFSTKKESHIKKTSLLSLDTDLVSKFIFDLARKTDKEPEDAKFKIEDGKVAVFSLNEKGARLDQEKSLEILVAYLKGSKKEDSISLPVDSLDPQVAIDSIDNMGITDLIGEGRSNFRGSPKNRIFNIKVASDRFNGILIKPKGEFSFVRVLGEVDGEHGYLPELVIKKDKTEPEFGGGICQVSTTAFRAAINSGLEITARRSHAYPVSYYNPQGMDATVYVPKPDLKFINNTPGYILVQTKIEGTELIFDFYGTSDGRRVNVIGPKVLEKNPDGSMKTVFTQQVYDKDENLTREDVFKSSYDSPSKYPHPGTTNDVLTQKPNSWSDREWKDYKKAHGI